MVNNNSCNHTNWVLISECEEVQRLINLRRAGLDCFRRPKNLGMLHGRQLTYVAHSSAFILEHVFSECFLCARHFARHWGCDVEQHIVPGREEASGSVLWVKQADLRMVLIDKRRETRVS